MKEVVIEAVEISHREARWRELVRYTVGHKKFKILVNGEEVYSSTAIDHETLKKLSSTS